MTCGGLHCQKGFNILVSYDIGQMRGVLDAPEAGWAEGDENEDRSSLYKDRSSL